MRTLSQAVQRALYALEIPVSDLGVDEGRLDVVVTEQFLDVRDIRTRL